MGLVCGWLPFANDANGWLVEAERALLQRRGLESRSRSLKVSADHLGQYGVRLKSDLRLPAFVTADAVGDQLNWANSIKREFLEAARDAAVEGWAPSPSDHNIYNDIVRLLARPGGGSEFHRLVGIADGEKRRGLMRAIGKKTHQALGSDYEESDEPADIVFKLLVADKPALAAWAAFEQMTWSRGPDDNSDALIEVVAQDDGLRAALGDYWTDWLALPNMRLPNDVAVDQRLPGAVNASENDVVAGDRAAWATELEDLCQGLHQASEFDARLLDRLAVALQRLEPLVARALERSVQDSVRLSEEAARQIGRLRDDLDALGKEATWRLGLIAGAERVQADPVGVDRLRAAADWAAAARAQSEAAAGRRKVALDRAQTDESDEAGTELTAANAERRRVRQAVDGEAADWMTQFSADAPESSGNASVKSEATAAPPETLAEEDAARPEAEAAKREVPEAASETSWESGESGAQEPESAVATATPTAWRPPEPVAAVSPEDAMEGPPPFQHEPSDHPVSTAAAPDHQQQEHFGLGHLGLMGIHLELMTAAAR